MEGFFLTLYVGVEGFVVTLYAHEMATAVDRLFLTLYVGVEDRSDEVAECQDSPNKTGALTLEN